MSRYRLVLVIGEKIFDVLDEVKSDCLFDLEKKRKEKRGYYDLTKQISQKELTIKMNGDSFPSPMKQQYISDINELRERCNQIEKKCQLPGFVEAIISILVFLFSFGLGFLIFAGIVYFLIKLINIS